MNKLLADWQNKIDALSQRERVILMVTVLVAVVMLLQLLLLDPLLSERDTMKLAIRKMNTELTAQQSEQQIIQAQIAAGVNRQKLRQRDKLKAELQQLNTDIEKSVVAMIPPHKMAEVLEGLLVESKSLRLLSLENRPVASVLEQNINAEESEATAGQVLYKHGFVLRFNGSYMSVIDYFNKLAALPWRFYWDSLSYSVDGYPQATITLEVHTVSMNEEWIGV